jgi:23S rRNA U2552 (ribose-2'-O)-methylase RlmE/FtsJ
MGELVPYDAPDERSYDEQIKDALLQALATQGTVISDLEAAINCILQMERAMQMLAIPNPHQVTADYLKEKYNMRAKQHKRQWDEGQSLLERAKEDLHIIEVVEPKAELVESVDGEIVDE